MRLLTFILMSFPFSAACQMVAGNYVLEKEGGMLIYRIQLMDSSKFIKSSTYVLGHGSDLEKGHYSDRGDTLVLQYEPYMLPKPWFEIEKQIPSRTFTNKRPEKAGDHLSLSLKLFDEEKTPLAFPGSFVNFLAGKSVVAQVSTDDKGHLHFSASDDFIDHLEIISLGYDVLKIDLEPFRGFDSQINIFLTQQGYNTYGASSREEKYVWRVRAKHLRYIAEDGSLGDEYSRRAIHD